MAKKLNQSRYSKEETAEMYQAASRKGWKTSVLARRFSKKFKRPEGGVYAKLREMRVEIANPQPIKADDLLAKLNKKADTQYSFDLPPIKNITAVEVTDGYIKLIF